MLESSIIILFGFFFLAIGAERFVTGASAIARNFGISPLLIGLTIVALGTSAPEIMVSIMAALQGKPALGVGNALGSNIANIGLVLGVAAIVAPLEVRSGLLRREYPLMFLAMLLLAILILDGHLGRLDGGILLLAMAGLMIWFIVNGTRAKRNEPLITEYNDIMPTKVSLGWAFIWLLVGLALLLVSAHVLVIAAVKIATVFGISELVIGLTIVALGTSLPEVATSIAAAVKNEPDIAIGNILGSNMFNLLAVVPFAGLIHPSPLAMHLLSRDLPIMVGITTAFFVMSLGFKGVGTITRFEGCILLITYVGYLALLYFDTVV